MSNIVDLTTFKGYAGITDTSEDVKLQIIIDAVNLTIDKYVGRQLDENTYSEYYDGPGTEALCLRNFPIIELTSISIAGVAVPEFDGTFSQDWWFFPSSEIVPVGGYYIQNADDGIVFHTICWPAGRDIIQVNYKAGYHDIPADILFGTLEMVQFYRNITQKTGIASESLGAYSVSLMAGLSNMEGDLTIPSIPFKMCLDRYRVNYYAHLSY